MASTAFTMASIPSSIRLFPSQIRTSVLVPRTPYLSSKTIPFSNSTSSITFTRLNRPIKSNLQQSQPQTLDPTLLPKNLQDIISLFQSVQDPKAKYHQLLHYSSRLSPLDARYKTDEHRVRGCVSQVWVRAFPDPDDAEAVRFEADSDSALTKGLAALLVMGLSGAPAPVIARVPPEFVQLLGLRQSLTPSRNNGFLNMLKLMQQKALQIHARGGHSVVEEVLEGEALSSNGLGGDFVDGKDLRVNGNRDLVKDEVLDEKDRNFDTNGGSVNKVVFISDDSSVETGTSSGEGDALPSSAGGRMGARGERIRERLQKELNPLELEVENISYQHAGHAGVRGSGDGETHFNLRVVSKEFEGKSMLKRHRLVYDLLQEELQSGLHALSIVAKTPSEDSPR